MSDVFSEQIVSRQRVGEHGEVYTSAREVCSMLDLVKHETERIDSKFFEPACGHGNFLIEVLSRKLQIVTDRYRKSQFEFECYSIIAVSSIYGIDLLKDNVRICRARLFNKFFEIYKKHFGDLLKTECIENVEYILSKNIIWGDALTLRTVDKSQKPIVFSEWSPVSPGMIKRRDFSFEGLVKPAEIELLMEFSDLGNQVFIPSPTKDFPVTNHFRLKYAD